MHKLCVYVPTPHLELVKHALFEAGAGKIGNYDRCCWQTQGIGQFRALEGSEPFLGQQGSVEEVEEYKLEMVCEDQLIKAIVHALRESHPYEEPAFELYEMKDI